MHHASCATQSACSINTYILLHSVEVIVSPNRVTTTLAIVHCTIVGFLSLLKMTSFPYIYRRTMA